MTFTYPTTSFLFIGLLAVLSFLLGFAVLSKGIGGSSTYLRLLSIPVGAGLLICLLMVLAAAGALAPVPILLSAGLLGLLGLLAWLAGRRELIRFKDGDSGLPGGALALVAALLAYAAYAALGVPLEWDALSYHLPYARDYAEAAGLVVSEYLRFPLHAHNAHLVYAVALVLGDEVAVHLIHACAGVMVALGMVAWCRENLSRGVGVVSAALYIGMSATYYGTAYADLVLGFFVFYAFYALSAWQKTERPAYLLVSAFLLAMAAGTKYQALGQLAVFFVALLTVTRSPTHFIRVGLVLALFGTFWYIRNFLVSGDPLHPFGGPLLGFWLWNEADLAGQFGNVAKFREHVHPLLLPALGSVFLAGSRKGPYRSLVIVGLGGLLFWYLTSRYDRYLLPTLPFLAILSVHVCWRIIRDRVPRAWRTQGGTRRIAVVSLLLAGIVVIADMAGKWADTCFTRSCVERVYERELLSGRAAATVPGFERLSLYQLGLENELYRLGKPVWGDWFGPYRYHDLMALGGDADETAAYLRQVGADSLIINKSRQPFRDYAAGSQLDSAFVKAYEDESVVLYTLPEATD